MAQLLILRVVAVFLRLKFKCRMRVQVKGATSTKDVESDNGLYRFQEDMDLQQKSNTIELSFALITEKGSQYSGGVLRINLQQLRFHHGIPLKLPISKCIDKEAWCELKIILDQGERTTLLEKERSSSGFKIQTPLPSKRTQPSAEPCITDTQSQFSLSIPFTSFPRSFTRRETCQTARIGQRSNHKDKQDKSRNHSPNISFTNRTSPDLIEYRQKTEEAIQQAEFSMTRAKRIEAKLQQEGIKLKNQQDKRKSLEGKEHKQQIELLRLMMERQQTDKELQKKDSQIKQLTKDLLHFKRQERNRTDAQETLKLRQDQINKLHEILHSHENQIAKLKSAYLSETNRLEGELKRAKVEKDKLRKDAREREDCLQGELNRSQEQISQLKLRSVCFVAERQLEIKAKNLICRNENADTTGEIEAEQEKKGFKKYLELMRIEAQQKIKNLSKQNQVLSLEITFLRGEQEREKGIVTRLLNEKKMMQKEHSEMEILYKQCSKQLQIIRQSLEEEISQKQGIRQDNKKVKSKFQQLLQEIQDLEKIRLEESQHNYQQIEILAEKYRQSEQTNRLLQQELQTQGTQLQKSQKAESTLRNELFTLRDRQKKWKGQLSKKQTECIQIKAELDALSHKIFQKMDNSSQFTPNFSFLQQEEQPQDHKLDKLLSTLQSHQKYLETQLNDQKIKNHEHICQINSLKQQVSQFLNRESEWKQQQKTFEQQVNKLNIEVVQLSRQLKELQRKDIEQIYKLKSVQQQLEKEKNSQKVLLSKYELIQKDLASTQEEVVSLKNQRLHLQEQYKGYEGQVESLTVQVQYLDRQRQKYLQLKENLQYQLRSTKDHLYLASAQIKEKAELLSTQQKKHLQDMIKLENKLKILKSEGQKFKQALRKIVGQYKPPQSSNSKSSLNASRKNLRSDKVGLPPATDLLLEVEELLKLQFQQKAQRQKRIEELEKQLSTARQQGILSINKAQNIEGELKLKLQQLICNYENMKTFYEERDQNMKNSLQQKQWDINCLTQQLKSYKEVKQHLSSQLNHKIQELNILDHQSKQAQILSQQRISNLNDQIDQLNCQLANLQSQYNKLEQTNCLYRAKEESWHLQKNNLTHNLQQLQDCLKKARDREMELNQLIKQMKKAVSAEQARVVELTQANKQLQLEIDVVVRQKVESHSLVRNLIKQKEQLLQQYLQSEQEKNQLENIQFHLKGQLIGAQQHLQDLKQRLETAQIKNEALNENNRQALSQKQKINQKIKEAQILNKQLLQKIQNIQVQLKQKDKNIKKLAQDATIKQHETKVTISKMHDKILELEVYQIEQQENMKAQRIEVQTLMMKNEELRTILDQQKRINENMQIQIQSNRQRFNEFTKAENKYQHQLMAKEQEIVRIMQKLRQVQTELEQRDLKNYQLSSELYELESQKLHQIQDLSRKISEHQATIFRYLALSQKLQEQLKESFKDLAKEKQNSHSLQVELLKTASTLEALRQQIEKYHEKVQNLQHQLITSRSISKNKCISFQQQQLNNAMTISDIRQQLSRKEDQIHRHRLQNQALQLTTKTTTQNAFKIQLQLKEAQEKITRLVENQRKYQQQLKIFKEEINNLQWSCQREVKKTFGARLRNLHQLDMQRNEALDQWVRLTEEGVIQTIRRLISFLK